MLFTQPIFGVFFLVVLGLHWLVVKKHRSRKYLLLAASYLFYGAWDPRFLSLIILSTLVDHVAATRIAASDSQGQRKIWMAVSLFVNLGMLGIFKYANFFADSAQDLAGRLGMELSEVTLNITLPVGISFFTFQTLSYTIDVYRGNLEPRKSLLDVAVFVAFFPQLVAGPIVRASHFLPQLDTNRVLSSVRWRPAIVLFAVGFFKKAVLADTIGVEIDPVWSDPAGFDAFSNVLAVLGYTAQIYCDFSGYSDMAIAVAMMLGYSLGENFNFPYFSSSIDVFWRRWHISLSSWLRDYLYIPLGGNRKGVAKTYRNLFLTMLLGGLWHGAAWTFVVWGAMHGSALAVNKAFSTARQNANGGVRPTPTSAGLALSTFATFYLVACAWIFFRASTFGEAWAVLTRFVTLQSDGAGRVSAWIAVYLVVAAALHTMAWRKVFKPQIERLSNERFAVGLGLAAAFTIAFLPLSSAPFIYFQF